MVARSEPSIRIWFVRDRRFLNARRFLRFPTNHNDNHGRGSKSPHAAQYDTPAKTTAPGFREVEEPHGASYPTDRKILQTDDEDLKV